MFFQQVPGMMGYFFFMLDTTISKVVSAIAAGTTSVSILPPFPC